MDTKSICVLLVRAVLILATSIHLYDRTLLGETKGAKIGKPPGHRAPAQPKLATAVTETPFDSRVHSLPRGFHGNTVEWVLKTNMIEPKGEFETTAAYNARLEQFSTNEYGFVPDEQPSYKYDADNQQFDVVVYPTVTSVSSRTGWYFRPFAVHERQLSASEFVGSNAYGAKTVVTKRKWKYTQVVTDDTQSILELSHEPLTFRIAMSSELAQAAKPNLRMLYVCVPKAIQYDRDSLAGVPYATGYRFSEATISSPTEHWSYYVALRADIRQVWFFDSSTGSVYARFLPDGTSLDIKPMS